MKIDNDYEQHGNDGTRCAWKALIRLGPNLRTSEFSQDSASPFGLEQAAFDSCELNPVWGFHVQMVSNMVQVERRYQNGDTLTCQITFS